MTDGTLAADGTPLDRLGAPGFYRCLDHPAYAHEASYYGCDCMRRRRPALPFRAASGALYTVATLGWWAGLAVAYVLSKASDGLGKSR
jgi:hypothetical protein